MIIPTDVKCTNCGKVFCCSKCRVKHEQNEHAELEKIRDCCFICNNRPFPLQLHFDVDSREGLVQHILQEHLPLHCKKCNKVFQTIDDFEDITKCQEDNCTLEKPAEQQVDDKPSIVVEKSQTLENNNIAANQMTPLSKWNLKWKRKSQSMTDSISNVSAVHSCSIQTSRAPNSPKAKPLVRTTSTPFHNFNYLSSKPNESYSMSSQMSSIHHMSVENDTNNTTPPSPTPKELYKMKAVLRNRSKVAATPLRQVMSKSIQRAIAQHTSYYKKGYNPTCQRKMSFDSTASISQSSSTEDASIVASSPLDLRTTPAIKRSSSESSTFRFRKPKPIDSHSSTRVSSIHLCDHSSQISVIERDLSAYESCQNSMEDLVQQNRKNQLVDDHLHTPKNAGAIPKKVISFITPADVTRDMNDLNNNDCETWGTPCASPVSRSYSLPADSFLSKKGSSSDTHINYSIMTEDNTQVLEDDVFLPNKTKQGKQAPTGGSKLWSIVSNVIKLASRTDEEEMAQDSEAFRPVSLIKRAASFAGYLTNKYYIKSEEDSGPPDQEYNLKRRRTVSIVTNDPNYVKSPCAKRKRIQGRQPIDRMKNISFNTSSQ